MSSMGQPDLSAFRNLRALADSADGPRLIEHLRVDLERTNELRESVGALVGRATSDDGYVRVTCTSAAGLAELTLESRAMRVPSHYLAAQIVKVTAAARADLDRQRLELVAELATDTAEVGRPDSAALLGELSTGYARSMGELESIFAKFRAELGR